MNKRVLTMKNKGLSMLNSMWVTFKISLNNLRIIHMPKTEAIKDKLSTYFSHKFHRSVHSGILLRINLFP